MNPLAAVGFLPLLERAVISQYFGRYLLVAVVLIIALLIFQKKGAA
jgi:hypothetical protein